MNAAVWTTNDIVVSCHHGFCWSNSDGMRGRVVTGELSLYIRTDPAPCPLQRNLEPSLAAPREPQCRHTSRRGLFKNAATSPSPPAGPQARTTHLVALVAISAAIRAGAIIPSAAGCERQTGHSCEFTCVERPESGHLWP